MPLSATITMMSECISATRSWWPPDSSPTGILLAANVHFWLFSRFIHLELLLSFFLLCSATLFLLGKGKVSAVGAGVFAALAIGTKFTAIFLIVPLAALLIVRRGDRRRLYLAAGAGLVVLP